MRFLRSLLVMMVFGLVMAVAAQTAGAQGGGAPQGGGPAPKPLMMAITAFADGSDIPAKYTQAGDQTSPAITWTNAPAGTITFLLHMHDMEASRNKTFADQRLFHLAVLSAPLPKAVSSSRKTSPPFITNFTRCISLISCRGSPETA